MKFDESAMWMVLFWAISIIVLILLLTRIFGHSATDMQIYLGFFAGLIVILGHVSNLHYKLGKLESSVASGFQRVRDDISEIKIRLEKKRGEK